MNWYTRAMETDKSKSQVKREAKALQDFGASLTQLSLKQLAQIPLPEGILDAVLQTRKIKSNVAKKRHIQMLGKLLRNLEDITPIQQAYHKITNSLDLKTAKFHLVEQWRAKLLSDEPNALTELLDQHPCDDVQQLRQLIRKAKAERDHAKNQGASKALFRLIRELIT